MSDDNRGECVPAPDAAGLIADQFGPTSAAAVADTLRILGAHLDAASVRGSVTPAADPFPDIAFGTGVAGDGQDALLGSLGVDAVIDTNATVSQRSLREFLR